ncbi:MAG: nucleotidyltransferase domain-containing protein [Selenomonas sp.]|jgi:predicted nucleotidyltransferase|nr:nucleotidyltransferase domain-containing protein [Selenomonas ruminantium]MBO6293133.1 nucleotidyltransferase domain-containing protein [Selenomonas sp.]
MNLSDRIIADLEKLALEYGVVKIILFGSRSRGDNSEKSDVDIAVYGCRDFVNFKLDVEEKVWTLLTFDIVNMDNEISEELAGEIKRDGVVIYEKI